MNQLSVMRFGFALGMASAIVYVGCVVVMLAVPHEVAVRFFNSLLHGLDVSPVMRWDIPWWEVVLGVIETFILGWLFGAVVAGFYNLSARTEH